jgi:hypothetical protein
MQIKEKNMICKKCNKDHSIENEGPLTECEKLDYFSQGSWVIRNGEKIRAFGTGNRFKFDEVKSARK